MCDVLALVVNKGLRLISDVWVDKMKLPYRSTTWGHLLIDTLFVQVMSKLM